MTGTDRFWSHWGSWLGERPNQVQVRVPQRIVDKPKSPMSKNAGGTFFFDARDFAFRIPVTAEMRSPYPPSPKIIPKKMRMNHKNQPEISYSKYPGTVPRKSVSG